MTTDDHHDDDDNNDNNTFKPVVRKRAAKNLSPAQRLEAQRKNWLLRAAHERERRAAAAKRAKETN